MFASCITFTEPLPQNMSEKEDFVLAETMWYTYKS